MNKEAFWNKRKLKIYSRNEYGDEFSYICDLPIFFPNRLYARLEKVELVSMKPNGCGGAMVDEIIQTIEESKKKIDIHNEFQSILTRKDLMEKMKL